MRIIILMTLLFAFSVGTVADVAHAAMLDHTCASHQASLMDNGEPCHSEAEQEVCSDCSCVHSHNIATYVEAPHTDVITSQQYIAYLHGNRVSDVSYDLRRPPRL